MKNLLLPVIFLLSGCTGTQLRIPVGSIDQDTGLIKTETGWKPGWWAEKLARARTAGCQLEDSCGMFPPLYVWAEYCGEPIVVCPGEHWGQGKAIKYTAQEKEILCHSTDDWWRKTPDYKAMCGKKK